MAISDLFRRDPRKRLQREIRLKSARAVEFQRNGKLREYAALVAEVQRLEDELDALDRQAR